MALIPQEKNQQYALIAIIVALGALYGFWEYWRAPKLQALQESEARLERLETQNRAAQVRALQRERLETQAATYERYVRRLEELVPADNEVPGLLRDITAEARRLDVDLDLIEPFANQLGPSGYYTLQSYTIRVIGEYHNVGQFLTTIASLSRIITPVDVAIEAFENNELLDLDAGVVVDFRIETYVLPSDGIPQPAAPEEGVAQ